MTDFSVAEVERILGVHFKDPSLLHIAFGWESAPLPSHYHGLTQRMLAYYGDALIEGALRKWVLRVNRKHPEQWNDWRSYAASNLVLARLVRQLELDLHATFPTSRWDEDLDDHALGTLFEAIPAAIDLDRGHAAADNFLTCHYLRHLPGLVKERMANSEVARLTKKVRELIGSEPTFGKSGPMKLGRGKRGAFITCFVSGVFLSRGEGKSEVDARIRALVNGIDRLTNGHTVTIVQPPIEETTTESP